MSPYPNGRAEPAKTVDGADRKKTCIAVTPVTETSATAAVIVAMRAKMPFVVPASNAVKKTRISAQTAVAAARNVMTSSLSTRSMNTKDNVPPALNPMPKRMIRQSILHSPSILYQNRAPPIMLQSLTPTSPSHSFPRRRPSLEPQALRFSPWAWLKLQYLCHAGPTEVGAFGISAPDDLLHVDQLQTVLQGSTVTTVEFSDESVADHFDRCADEGIAPSHCGRIWIHTHPGASAEPSGVDEKTFARVFGPCDWALMFILSRTGQTYARLEIHAGPGATLELPVSVDWPAWSTLAQKPPLDLPDQLRLWQHEYETNVYNLNPLNTHARHGVKHGDWRTPLDAWEGGVEW